MLIGFVVAQIQFNKLKEYIPIRFE